MSFLPLLTVAMSDVPPGDAGLGSAIVNLSLQLAAAVDLAILAAVAAYWTHTQVAAGAPMRDALSSGHHAAYGVAAIGVLTGLVFAVIFIRNPRRSAAS
jgi:hypothetical protein